MTNLKEQRMIAAHQHGMRDYREGREMLVPAYLHDEDERTSYCAGYLGAKRRTEQKAATR